MKTLIFIALVFMLPYRCDDRIPETPKPVKIVPVTPPGDPGGDPDQKK